MATYGKKCTIDYLIEAYEAARGFVRLAHLVVLTSSLNHPRPSEI